jgi:hypothetical protein
MSNPVNEKEYNWLSYTRLSLIIILFLFIFLRYLYPIYYGLDTDLFWHLKTGEVIFNTHQIPSVDPFTHTPADQFREKFLLGSYWLSDLILFLIYKISGFTGLVLLRSAIICSTIFIVFLKLRERDFHLSIVLSFLLGLALMPTSTLRPNLFTIFFVAALILLIEKYRETLKKRYGAALFVLMLSWANMHGGYIVGVGILVIYLTAALFSLKMSGDEQKTRKARHIALTSGISVLISFVNPSGIDAIRIAGELSLKPSHKLLISYIETDMGLFRNIAQHPNEMVLLSFVIIGFIIISTTLNILRKKAELAPTLIVLFLFVLTISSVRSLPLFLVAGLLVNCRNGNRNVPLFKRKSMELTTGVIIFSLLIFFIYKEFPREHPGKLQETDAIYLQLGEFLNDNQIKGNMLNQEITGNFIIYKLFPKYKVFTDSRYISVDVFFDGLDMFYAVEEPTLDKNKSYVSSFNNTILNLLKGDINNDYSKEYWHTLLEKYNIDFIVGRISHPNSGSLFPIFMKLIGNENWKLIYSDGSAVVLVRDNGKNDELLRRVRPLDKTLLFDQAIKENLTKNSPSAYETLAFSFLMRGEVKNAERFARYALRMNSDRKIAKACIQKIESLNEEMRDPAMLINN